VSKYLEERQKTEQTGRIKIRPQHERIPNPDILGRGIRTQSEVVFALLGLSITLVAMIFLYSDTLNLLIHSIETGFLTGVLEQIAFLAIVTFLVYGSILYLVTRIGYLQRLRKHHSASWKELSSVYEGNPPRLTIVIPSYKENPYVIRRSILSSALQQSPDKRVVLLIDNPPHPYGAEDTQLLGRTRGLAKEIENLLGEQARWMGIRWHDFQQRMKDHGFDPLEEGLLLSDAYLDVASWFRSEASRYEGVDHNDDLFVQKTFVEPSHFYARRAQEIMQHVMEENFELSLQDVSKEHRFLASLFQVEITSFERKKYTNLSNEPNKAMNLNSYIGLLGKKYREVSTNGDLYLLPTESPQPDLSIPDADYLVTLDADSILTPDYALRLIHYMEQPENRKVAVAQTPYSAVPNPPTLIERVAGATTDIQYLIHQGFTRLNATFWVGANALLRTAALEDIKIVEEEREFPVTRYIQDRTVIEDTESSVDLVAKGWRLYNYPERLSYSETPPDFGALLIQRRRWANGGLIILPKLLRYLFSRPLSLRKCAEGLMRFHYLTGTVEVNVGMILLLTYPFEQNLRSIWLPLTAAPYFFFYGRDLMQAGYRLADLFRIYALNLMLIPINLGGVLKSIQQAWTKKKIPFSRTPKILGRTAAPHLYIIAEYLIMSYCFGRFAVDSLNHQWPHALFVVVNGCFLLYAIGSYMELKESIEGIWKRTRHAQSVRRIARSRGISHGRLRRKTEMKPTAI